MTKSNTETVLLALIATLEKRARAKGHKSIVKSVVNQLADTGSSPELIAEIAALRGKKNDAVEATPAPKTPNTAKTKRSEASPASPEAATVQG